MGFDNIHVFISMLLRDNIERALHSQFTFHDIMNVDDVNWIPNPVFFLAGPEDCIVESMQNLDSMKPTWVAVEGHLWQDQRLGESFQWAEVHHAQVGGGH